MGTARNVGEHVSHALRLIRTQAGLTQTAASKRDGAPDFRTLSHWETKRKNPSLLLLGRYLDSMGLDFRDFQVALDAIAAGSGQSGTDPIEVLEDRFLQAMKALEQRVVALERPGA